MSSFPAMKGEFDGLLCGAKQQSENQFANRFFQQATGLLDLDRFESAFRQQKDIAKGDVFRGGATFEMS